MSSEESKIQVQEPSEKQEKLDEKTEKKEKKKSKNGPAETKIILRNYDKGIFFYPLLIYTFIAWIIEFIYENQNPGALPRSSLAILWLFFFFLNIIVVIFDINTMKLLAIIVAIAIIGLVLVILSVTKILSFANLESTVLPYFQPRMYAQFYLYVTVIFVLILIFVAVSSRFKYVRIEQNEIILKGILGNEKRFPTGTLQYRTKIVDVFEWLTLRAGSLTLIFGKDETITLPTIPRIEKVEKKLQNLLNYIKVQN